MPQSSSVENITKALAKAQSEFEAITKNRIGQEGNQRFPYSTLSKVLEAVRPPLNGQGIFLSQPIVLNENGDQRVSTKVQLGDEWISTDGVLLSPGMVGSKNFGREVTYSKRYDLMSFLGVCAEDDDHDAPDLKPGEQKVVPKAAPRPVTPAPRPQTPPPSTTTQAQYGQPTLAMFAPAPAPQGQPIITNGVFSATNDDLPPIFGDDVPPAPPSEPQMPPELAEMADSLGKDPLFVPLSEKRNSEIQGQLREWTKDKILSTRNLSVYLDKVHDGKKQFDVPASQWEDTFKKISDAVDGGSDAIKAFFKENK